MNIDINKMSDIEIINLYKKLKKQIIDFEEDIKATEKVLEEEKLDYMTVREYKNDIITDNRQLNFLKQCIEEIINYALSKNIILEETEEAQEDNGKKTNFVLQKTINKNQINK